ncbi:MAG: Large extracellular alpha-helical protein [Limisphaerales bacterium]|nr:MAG: Large extracellular alpha-helical protein [Limisphaerales bacterium]KAG0509647.1 MAG: Large extracellular alpha-helical protein [Limisphaerales bacterium]TXT49747.1 MAG: Large extracellular alpha-helical protein [Limisphaerales bacterium]
MKTPLVVAAFLSLACQVFAAEPPANYAAQKAEAEKFIVEKSFAKANEIYRAVKVTNLPPTEQRWVLFRRADTMWRSEASTQRADTTKFDRARQELNVLLRDISREEEKDRTWVEAQESIADSYWLPRNQRNWGGAWQHYSQVLDWWAGQRASEESRNRYLNIVWRSAKPPQAEPYYRYGNYGNVVPLNILENALKIAATENDKAHAHYLLAVSFNYHGGDWDARARVPEHFEAALKPGKGTDWYDDALYHYAEWMMNQGRAVPLKDGNWTQEQDYVKALALFRRLVAEFNKGETRYWEQAQAQIRNITQVNVGVSVSHFFLPDSEVQYHLHWRNVKRIELALYPVDLTKDVNLATQDGNSRPSWLQTIDLAGREKVKAWEHDTKDKGNHRPGNAALRVDGKLRPGAYVLEARGGGQSARDLVLVTDVALVLKTSGKTALVFVTDALSGKPLANAKTRIWERWHVGGNKWEARSQDKVTDKDGLAVFEVARPVNNVEIFAAASLGDKQAFSPGNSYSYRDPHESWRIYAFTDRPAYRPKEKVEWKAVVRRYNGSVYSTPANETIWFRIDGPDGALVKEGELKLNEFGTAWASLELTETQRLGEYRVSFRDKAKTTHIGNATLFRLEEYKLPEFKVAVQTPEVDGKKKAFRTGDRVEVNIQADYYFGGPVANATVEVIVHQNPYYFAWKEPREFGWFYEENEGRYGRGRSWRGGGGGQILKRETLKTDATGKARLEFESPKDYGQDFEFRIEARVVDASRREITGSGNVRVTRQRYYVHAKPEHNLHKPGDKATVNFRAQDANEQPAVIEGIVKVTREFWEEIWVNPAGREVKGPELKALQSDGKFPPAPPAGQRPWRLKFRGYHSDDILTRTLKTDAEGKVDLVFTPEREGYYKVTWLTEDAFPNRPPQPIRAETTLWVANNTSTELGYRHGGVEIIVDKDTFRTGQKAPVMLVANSNDRYVLFTVEADELISHQVVHLTGTVKLVELALSDAHVPNVFLSAAMVADKQVHMDTKQVIVPPTKHFLTVDVKPDRTQYQPREDGTLLVTARDHEGKPVAAEVAVGLVDESVYYIQSDYAGDPRQFYFGTKRQQRTQTQSTFNQKGYEKFFEWKTPKGEVVLVQEEEFKTMHLYQELRRLGALLEGDWEEDEDYGPFRKSPKSVTPIASDKSELRKAGELSDRMELQAGGMAMNRMRGLAATPMSAVMPATMPPAAPAWKFAADALGRDEKAKQVPGEDGAEPNVVVRSDFRSTIIWLPDVKTGADGTARVPVKYPDSLTGWKATARAVGSGAQFGIANTTTRTKQPLIVRLQAPRFFVVGDEVVLSAVVNNNTDAELTVKVTLEAAGPALAFLPPSPPSGERAGVRGRDVTLKVPPNSEARADWKARVVTPGEVRLKTTAVGGKFSDAMEKTYLSHEHGIERFLTKAGKVRGSDITVRLDIPVARKRDTTTLVVQVAPSLAVTMLDALPYLIDYPYGCTEQTMSRFLPSVVTAKTLKDLGLQPEDVMSRVFGGIEARAGGAAPPNLGAKKDLAKLTEMTDAGLKRLYDFQHADGGWGWWKEGQSDRWMTAYVVWGLTLAKQSGVALKANVLERGAAFLDKTLVEEELNHDMQAFMLHATVASANPLAKAVFSPAQNKAWDNLWKNREGLNAYTRALLALAAHHMGKGADARTFIANLENGVKRDERPDASVLIGGQLPANAGVMGTAHWGEDGIYWRWSEGGVEATAFALRALLAIDPQSKLIEPVTNWLLKGRRGAQWSNTRDTAITVLALNDYLRVTKELSPELEYEVTVNGTSIAKRKVSGAEVFAAPSRFAVDTKLIKDGANNIRIQRKGEGPVYFAAEAKFFSLEEPIPASGNEIFVKREYFKLVGRPTLLKGLLYDKVPLLDGETVKSGERIETVLTIEAKNNYEYLLFEDLKPAGFEAVAVRSGESLYARELKSGAVERKFGVVGQPVPQAAPKSKAPSPKSKAAPSTSHIVIAGETLTQIAKKHGTTIAAITAANAGLDARKLQIGQQLNLPGAVAEAAVAEIAAAAPAVGAAIAPAMRLAAARPIGFLPPRPIGIGEPDFTGRTRWVYQELRDRKVALFLDKLPEGVWQLRYDMRAEVPGQFHALPVLGHAMYVPEIRCNGAELRVTVVDTK